MNTTDWPLMRLNGKAPLQEDWSNVPLDRLVPPGPGDNAGLRMDRWTGIDCDSPEAVEWWEANGPPTPYVSESREGHRVYWFAGGQGAGYTQWSLPDGSRGGEIKAGPGHQVVVPPSVHPATGTEYRWIGAGGELTSSAVDLPTIAAEQLPPPMPKKPKPDHHRDVERLQADGTTPYGRAILAARIADLDALDEPESGRNQTLGASGLVIGHYVAGGEIAYDDAVTELEAAVERCTERTGDGDWYVERHRDGRSEIERVLEKGMEEPQSAPDRPVSRPGPGRGPVDDGGRALTVTRACSITPRPVHWLWEGRLAVGTLALLAGREGIGKSTIAYSLAARITRGDLPGRYAGVPRAVVVAATEDSWEHTIVPRLMVAGADLNLVLKVAVATPEGVDGALSLPRDLRELEALIIEHDVALLVLDPLMSRLDPGLDTHKDAEVRRALEPVVTIANRAGATTLGLIHVNKSMSTDPATTIMGSRAFTAVARAILFALSDPDEKGLYHLGQPKNNLGRSDLPTLDYRISTVIAAETEEGAVLTSKIDWAGQSDRSIGELLASGGEGADARTATGEAADWLSDYLTSVGGTSASAKVKEEGRRAGHSVETLRRAKQRLAVVTESSGFPRTTYWRLSRNAPLVQSTQGLPPSLPTGATGATGQGRQVGHSEPDSPGETTPLPTTTPTGQSGATGFVQSTQSPQLPQAPRATPPTGQGGEPPLPVPDNTAPCHRCGDLTEQRAGKYSVPCCQRHGHQPGGKHDEEAVA